MGFFFNKKKQPAQPTAQAQPRPVEPKPKQSFSYFFWEEFENSSEDSNRGVLFPSSLYSKGVRVRRKWDEKADKLTEKIRRKEGRCLDLSYSNMVIYTSVFKTMGDSIYIHADGTIGSILMKDTYGDWIEIEDVQKIKYSSNDEWYIRGKKGSGYVKVLNSNAVPYLKRLARCVEEYANQ